LETFINLNFKQPINLALTALDETWGKVGTVLFLGEWCKKYKSRELPKHCSTKALEFHWDDREKLARDYCYLEALHSSLIESLGKSLNQLHGEANSKRYWQLLLDPWLMSYISVVFDRWESLRLVYDSHEKLHVTFLSDGTELNPPYAYQDFVDSAAFSDYWNHAFYQRIISHKYLNATSVSWLSNARDLPNEGAKVSKYKDINLRNILDGLIHRIFKSHLKSGKVILIGTTFQVFELLQLFLSIKQIPIHDPLYRFRLSIKENYSPAKINPGLRSKIKINFRSSSEFEEFLKICLPKDLPYFLIEGFKDLKSRAKSVDLNPRLIVTGTSHWGDVFAKMWFAEHIAKGGELLTLEHGGSLPPAKEQFNFESDISDLRASWFLPHHQKHIQMPPPKVVRSLPDFLSFFKNLISIRKYCMLVANECPRWVYRAHFYPMANQWSSSFQMVLDLYEQLDVSVKEKFRVKPYPSSVGWDTRQRFSDALGIKKLYRGKSLRKAYMSSRIIICSYPETTFSEAMATDIPTVLVYPEFLYELNDVAIPLFRILKEAKILFNDAREASGHINTIWDNPNIWWDSAETIFARSEFRRQALNIESGWLKKWANLLEARSLAQYNHDKTFD
jgi:putative transferase (TIGR04331 family)